MGGVLFYLVTLTSRPHIKAGFQYHHDIHKVTLEPLALTYFHSLCCSVYRSSLLPTWGLTRLPGHSLASALIPNVLHVFSGDDLCFPLTGVQILLWPDNPEYSG